MLVGMVSWGLKVSVDFKRPRIVFVVLRLSGPAVVFVLFVAPSAADVLRLGALGSPELEVLVDLVESALEVLVVLDVVVLLVVVLLVVLLDVVDDVVEGAPLGATVTGLALKLKPLYTGPPGGVYGFVAEMALYSRKI